MNVLSFFGAMFQYLTEGATEIFSPNHDEYPNVGIQPFDGEPLSKWIDMDRFN
jgi:hypothetical protein